MTGCARKRRSKVVHFALVADALPAEKAHREMAAWPQSVRKASRSLAEALSDPSS